MFDRLRRVLRQRLGVSIYPLRSAMHGAVNVWTRRWGYVCFKPPTRAFGAWWPWYFYLSPNATPWALTLLLGARFTSSAERQAARDRGRAWGHNYDLEVHDPQAPDAPGRDTATWSLP